MQSNEKAPAVAPAQSLEPREQGTIRPDYHQPLVTVNEGQMKAHLVAVLTAALFDAQAKGYPAFAMGSQLWVLDQNSRTETPTGRVYDYVAEGTADERYQGKAISLLAFVNEVTRHVQGPHLKLNINLVAAQLIAKLSHGTLARPVNGFYWVNRGLAPAAQRKPEPVMQYPDL